MDTCKGTRVSHTGWGYFELDLWHISYIIGGRNPKFSVWIDLEVVECHTLFIDHCVSFMKSIVFGGILSICDTIHDFV